MDFKIDRDSIPKRLELKASLFKVCLETTTHHPQIAIQQVKISLPKPTPVMG
jgi:hypothetical protein